jgi:phosphatidylglycerol:prolipoprotein diacylglycerol transferase
VNAGDFARVCGGGGTFGRSAGEIWADCTRALRVWEGGLVFYGGVIAAGAFALRFARREGGSPPGSPISSPLPSRSVTRFGRLGCYAAGCCYGKEVGGAMSEWGVRFPPGSVAFEQYTRAGLSPSAFTPRLHPTQLYEAAGELVIFTLLLALRGRARSRPGALLLGYLGLYALLRFVVEIFRGDYARKFVVGFETPHLAAWLHLPPGEPVLLSVGQLVSVLVMLAVGVALFRRWRRQRVTAGV